MKLLSPLLDDLDGDEVSDFIGTLMDQELDTIVEDNSLDILGESLVEHFKLAVAGKHSELDELFRKLDEEASKPKPNASRQNPEEGDSSESSEDEAEVCIHYPPELLLDHLALLLLWK